MVSTDTDITLSGVYQSGRGFSTAYGHDDANSSELLGL